MRGQSVPRPPAAADPRHKYRRQFGVIVLCRDEREQKRAYNSLRRRGYACRVVCT